MLWKPTQSNASPISRRRPLRFSTRAFLSAFCFLVAFAPLFSSASDEDYIAAVADDLGLDRGGLSLMVAGLTATGSSSGNITNDVAAILDFLQSNSTTYGLFTYPRGTQGLNLSRYLWAALFDGSGNDGSPNKNLSYLKLIYDKLQSTNSMDRLTDAFLDFTKEDGGSTLRETIEDIDATTYYSYEILASIEAAVSDNLSALYKTTLGISNYLDSFEYSSGLWHTHIDSSQWNDLMDILTSLDDTVSNPQSPFDDSAWYGFTDDVADIAGDIADILYYVHHIDQDIHDEMIAGSDEFSQAASETSQIVYEESSGQDAYEEQLADDTSDTSELLADNEPVYEVHYTDNPMEPLTNAVNFRAKMERHLPDLDNIDTTDKTRVYLFKTEWDTEGLLTRSSGNRSRSGMQWNGLENVYFDLSGSDPRVPNQLLNYATTAMAWAWNLSSCILAFLMLKQFWDWVAGWRA